MNYLVVILFQILLNRLGSHSVKNSYRDNENTLHLQLNPGIMKPYLLDTFFPERSKDTGLRHMSLNMNICILFIL